VRIKFLSEVEKRLKLLFNASKSGYKFPAEERYRLAGFIQAGIFLELAKRSELSELMEEIHYSIFAKSIQERKNENDSTWQDEILDYSNYDQPVFERNK